MINSKIIYWIVSRVFVVTWIIMNLVSLIQGCDHLWIIDYRNLKQISMLGMMNPVRQVWFPIYDDFSCVSISYKQARR